jgi:N-methylhydantoinase B/oxoprolinase/acetone carboxylase alpha subunit
LSPSENAAVVGGNVKTSQRVVDVILRAFEAAAASQGCMNNLTFGDATVGYYETIAGGAGAVSSTILQYLFRETHAQLYLHLVCASAV